MTQPKLTPPKKSPPTAATRIYDRSPEWKYHESMGKARSAISYTMQYKTAREGEIWEYVDGEWRLNYECKPGTHVDDLPWRRVDPDIHMG